MSNNKSTPVPTVARVTSLSHWTNLFHPQTGVFRSPSKQGETIEHLDIDLRYIHVEHDSSAHGHTASGTKGRAALIKGIAGGEQAGEVNLPRVCVLTLRGAEHCQDSDEAMFALAEVLEGIQPVEVRWLNASNDPAEQLTFATHLVHDAIIEAGQRWAMAGCLRKLVIQGGFPCPNLTAPTPFSLTPAGTPASSPGPGKLSFGSLVSALPSLSTTKPKPKVVDEERLKARAERKRLAEYTLKPRFEFAFGTWGAEEISWRLDGRYTPACIKSILEQLFKALAKTWPHPSAYTDLPLPSLFNFTPLDPVAISKIRRLPESLDLSQEIREYLEDTFFFSTEFEGSSHSRLFESASSSLSSTRQPSGETRDTDEHEATDRPEYSRQRQGKRFKAEMLLLNGPFGKEIKIVPFAELVPSLPDSITDSSPSASESGSPPGTAKDATFKLDVTAPSSGTGVPLASAASVESGFSTGDSASMPSMIDGTEGTDKSSDTDDEGEAVTPALGASMMIPPSTQEGEDLSIGTQKLQEEGAQAPAQASIHAA